MKPSDNRSERYSLQVISEFDACSQVTVGAANHDPYSGNFSNITGTPAKAGYYCRGMYNEGTTSLTVSFNIMGDSTTYVAEIASGQWHIPWMNISYILAAGTDDGNLRLGYSKRGKIDGTGIV